MTLNRFRLLGWTQARTPWVRAVRAWRNLLPDWTPSLDEQMTLETMPHEHRAVVAVISDGWDPGDPRWDCLMALLEWERRQERTRRQLADELSREANEMERSCAHCGGAHHWVTCPTYDNVVSMDEEFERLRHDSETTVETELPKPDHLTLVPTGTPKVFTVRTLRSIREEQMRNGE